MRRADVLNLVRFSGKGMAWSYISKKFKVIYGGKGDEGKTVRPFASGLITYPDIDSPRGLDALLGDEPVYY